METFGEVDVASLRKKQCKTQKPTRSILNASFRSIYSDLPQAKSVTGLLNTTSMYLVI